MPSIEQLEGLLAADPDDAFMHYALAMEYAKAGKHDKAIESYDRCMAIDEGYCYAYFHKAKTLEAAGRSNDAVSTLQAGLSIAQRVSDQKAADEIGGYLESLRTSS